MQRKTLRCQKVSIIGLGTKEFEIRNMKNKLRCITMNTPLLVNFRAHNFQIYVIYDRCRFMKPN